MTIDEFVKEAFFSNPEEMQRFEQLINLIPENARSILDVGCGPGVFLYLLKEKRKEIKEIGIEISENQIRYANNVLGVKVQYGSADDLKFSEKSFDVVTALEVLEHLPYEIYERACIEISRVAKSTIIISVPYNEDRGFIMCPVCRTTFNPNYHIRSFDEEILKNIFPDFTLSKILKIGKSNVVYYPFSILVKKIRMYMWKSKPFVCPICGFTNSRRKNKVAEARKKGIIMINFKRMLKLFISKNKPRWAIAVYNRKET